MRACMRWLILLVVVSGCSRIGFGYGEPRDARGTLDGSDSGSVRDAGDSAGARDASDSVGVRDRGGDSGSVRDAGDSASARDASDSVGARDRGGDSVTPPAQCPNIGDVCADGTVYAGISPDGNVPMYVTRCDAGLSWNGSACVNSRALHSWNAGNASNSYTDTSLVNCATEDLCDDSGKANTLVLISEDSDAGAAGIQVHSAAQLCADATTAGHDDWYLPSINELIVINASKAEIGNLDLTGALFYWSSSEYSARDAWRMNFGNGARYNRAKQNGYAIRCARKDTP